MTLNSHKIPSHILCFLSSCLCTLLGITRSMLEGHLIVRPRRKWFSCACHSAWPCYLVLFGRSCSNQSNGRTCMSLAHGPFCTTKHWFIQDCNITIWRCSRWWCRRTRIEAGTGCCEGFIDFFAQSKNSKRHGKVTNFESLTSWNTEPILPIRCLCRTVSVAGIWVAKNLFSSRALRLTTCGRIDPSAHPQLFLGGEHDSFWIWILLIWI